MYNRGNSFNCASVRWEMSCIFYLISCLKKYCSALGLMYLYNYLGQKTTYVDFSTLLPELLRFWFWQRALIKCQISRKQPLHIFRILRIFHYGCFRLVMFFKTIMIWFSKLKHRKSGFSRMNTLGIYHCLF